MSSLCWKTGGLLIQKDNCQAQSQFQFQLDWDGLQTWFPPPSQTPTHQPNPGKYHNCLTKQNLVKRCSLSQWIDPILNLIRWFFIAVRNFRQNCEFSWKVWMNLSMLWNPNCQEKSEICLLVNYFPFDEMSYPTSS